MKESRLYRSTTQRAIGGVAGGIAEFFDIDPVIVRIIFILLLIFSKGGGLLVYIILWIAIPERPITAQMFSDSPPSKPFEGSSAYESPVYDPVAEAKNRRKSGSILGGVILICIGVIALSARYIPYFSFHDVWPTILVAAGLVLIITAIKKGRPKEPIE